MRLFVILGALISVWLVAGSATAAPAGAALREELIRLETERQAAYVAGDREVLDRQFAAEYKHTNLRGGVTRRDEELAFYAPGTFSLESGSLTDVEVQDYGETAVLAGVIDWRGAAYRPSPTITVDLSGRFRVTRVYVRREGRWQLASSHASQIPPSPGGERSAPAAAFYAVYVKDAAASAAWYERVFGLRTVARTDRPAFDQRMLVGDRLMVEIIQLRPQPPAPSTTPLGYAKAGPVIADFDATVSRWRAEGIRFSGRDVVIRDAAVGLDLVQLLDPDDNIVQVYGVSETAPSN